jgi:hypothetical protein
MAEIDLHTHSTASDGTLSPAELVREAKRCGLRALALTDHDTTNGLEEAIEAGRIEGVELIPGCELSVDYPRGQMHILGLWLPAHPEGVQHKLAYLRERRHSRNERIIAKLRKLGLDIDYAEVRDLAGEASVGRPHIARVLVHKGLVGSVQGAFDRYIGPRGKAYVPKDKLKPGEAIEVLKRDKATVILAHPYSLELGESELRSEVAKLQELGLDGAEVYYPEHTEEQTETYRALCRELDLLMSGGSDFHGSVKPDIALGTGRGDLRMGYELVQRMKEHRRARNLWIT